MSTLSKASSAISFNTGVKDSSAAQLPCLELAPGRITIIVIGINNGFIPQTVLVVCVISEDPFVVETKGKLSKMAPYCYLTITQVQQNASG